MVVLNHTQTIPSRSPCSLPLRPRPEAIRGGFENQTSYGTISLRIVKLAYQMQSDIHFGTSDTQFGTSDFVSGTSDLSFGIAYIVDFHVVISS